MGRRVDEMKASEIVKSETRVCAFINTNDKPVRVKRYGLFRKVGKVVLELIEVFYFHPETEMLTVSVFKFVVVKTRPYHEPIFEQSIKAMNALSSLAELDLGDVPVESQVI